MRTSRDWRVSAVAVAAPCVALFLACSPVEKPETARIASVSPSGEASWVVRTSDRQLELHLSPNERLFGADYGEIRLDAAQQPIPHPPSAWANATPCFYTGTATVMAGPPVDGPTLVAIRTCDGPLTGRLTGLVQLGTQSYVIQPTEPDSAGRDVAHLLSPVVGPEVRCPVDGEVIGALHDHGVSELPVAGMSPPPPIAWVDTHLTNDAQRFAGRGALTEVEAATIFNITAAMYMDAPLQRDVRPVLTSQTTFTAGDPYAASPVGGGEVDALALLLSYNAWADTVAPAHDNHQLLSGYDFDGPTVGLAALGQMCAGELSGGVNMAASDGSYLTFTASTMAHEMGHNFSMDHDGQASAWSCASTGFIMASATQLGSPGTTFSACSVANIDSFLLGGGGACLDDEPTGSWGGPECGNGLVEAGEVCDCGPSGCAGVDPCCDGATCQLAVGATCSAGDACCDESTCDVKTAGESCREAGTDCDLEETCDGVGSTCPDDLAQPAGTTCALDGTGGVCHDAVCHTYDNECAVNGALYTGGPYAYGAACQVYIDADPCGPLICEAPGGGCALLSVSLPSDGVACGTGMQCLAGDCVTSDVLDPACVDDADADGVCDPVDLCDGDDATGDSDSDGLCDDIDPCVLGPDVDSDGDGVCDAEDLCLGNDTLDSDGDGIPDDCDVCVGDDATGDADGDGLCDDTDACLGDNSSGDADADGICDDLDACLGDEATGDSDGDGVCDDIDPCVGAQGVADSDGDGICDDLDTCVGDDTTGDTDGDGTCDDIDPCTGNNASGDSDADGICDDLDLCEGLDAAGDSDGDGVCDDIDLCIGDETTGDTDGDGLCDDIDLCYGDQATGDADADGICDDVDPCFGDHLNGDADSDGLCDELDPCYGDESTGDADADGICDDVDPCFGNHLWGDSDWDGICNELDVCVGDDASGDSDGDLICDDIDFCEGADGTGDADLDGVCNDLDQCIGSDASGDSDGDGVCDDLDPCTGDPATGDTDGDGVCDDLDGCVGHDGTGDVDGDGVCGDLDVCVGNDATGDTDLDGVCDDIDVCLGNDALGDTDSDGVCDDNDVCIGNDALGDGDGDGVCDDLDACTGTDALGDTDGDGVCDDLDARRLHRQ